MNAAELDLLIEHHIMGNTNGRTRPRPFSTDSTEALSILDKSCWYDAAGERLVWFAMEEVPAGQRGTPTERHWNVSAYQANYEARTPTGERFCHTAPTLARAICVVALHMRGIDVEGV